jgi:hypothetical protein
LEKWRPANLFDDRTIILAVDVVAFRPNVTVTEEGEVRGLKNLKRLDESDLFTEFLKDPPDFAQFLQDHWTKTYSGLFAFYIRCVNSAFHCSIIHVYPAENGEGNSETVEKSLALKNSRLNLGLLFLDLFLMTILVLTSSIRSSCGNGSRIF